MGIFSKHCATCKHSNITSCSFDLPEFQSAKPTTAISMSSRKKSPSSLFSARSVGQTKTLYCAPSKEVAFCIIREMQELHPDWHFYSTGST